MLTAAVRVAELGQRAIVVFTHLSSGAPAWQLRDRMTTVLWDCGDQTRQPSIELISMIVTCHADSVTSHPLPPRTWRGTNPSVKTLRAPEA